MMIQCEVLTTKPLLITRSVINTPHCTALDGW